MGTRGPKGDKLISDALRVAMLREAANPDHKNRVYAMAEKMAELAEEGDRFAVEFVTDRIEGKPTQTLAHGGAEDLPPVSGIAVQFVRPDDTADNG